MADDSGGTPSARQQHSWCRPPAWPDGRLFHPGEDRTVRVTLGASASLLCVWVWALGRSDYFALAADGWWILAAGLLAASALCIVIARRRIRCLAAHSGVGPCSREPSTGMLRGWRSPRWSDGRLVAVKDPAVATLLVVCSLAFYAKLWLLGEAGVPSIDISGYREPLLPILQVTTLGLLWAMMVRTQIVRAAVEEWIDEDRQLGFIERRIAALATEAKRAKDRFAPSE